MDTVLLVSEQRMKQWSSLDNNIRIDVLTPSILQAQDIYIQDTLGTAFYTRLKAGVVANDLTTNESVFLKDYIGPCLIQYALYLLLPSLKYKMVEKGILNGTSEETQPMRTVEQTATPTVAAVTKSTVSNINKLKVYLSNETEDRRNIK